MRRLLGIHFISVSCDKFCVCYWYACCDSIPGVVPIGGKQLCSQRLGGLKAPTQPVSEHVVRVSPCYSLHSLPIQQVSVVPLLIRQPGWPAASAPPTNVHMHRCTHTLSAPTALLTPLTRVSVKLF